MAAVAFYSVPYEAVTRLWIIPMSLTAALFPAFSALEGIGGREKLRMLFARSVKHVLLVLGPIVLMLILFAKEILQTWLGKDFAIQSELVLQILALDILINSLAFIPYELLRGVGRPDIPAKIHLLELPIYTGIAWLLISRWGIVGAAAAWTLRVTLEALLLFGASVKVCQFSPRLLTTYRTTLTGVALLPLTGIAYGLKNLMGGLSLLAQSAIFAALIGVWAWFSWWNILDALEREAILKVMKLWDK